MSEKTRRYIISCVTLIGVICICISLVSIGGALGLILKGREVGLPVQPILDKSTPTTTAVIDLTPEEIEKQMDIIQQQVISLRGLQPGGPVQRALLTPEQLRVHVSEEFLKDYTPEDVHRDTIVLSALGLLEPDFDLHTFFLELYSEQVAGFYDHETKEMYVVKGESFRGPERLTYAHEYQHVLQDQNYDIENGLNYNDDACEQDSERCAAVQALIEGDATLLELSWFSEYATSQDRKEIFDFYQEYESPVYDNAPAFMKEDFLFPYQAGQEFVQYLFDEGGWEAVDAVYQNLPVSTEQILHPEKYPQDKPIEVTIPSLDELLGSGWEEIDRGVMGEWYTFLILAYGLDTSFQQETSLAQTAAAGWGGDTYIVYYHSQLDEIVLVLITYWESSQDASEFADVFQEYANDRFGGLSLLPDGFTGNDQENFFVEFHWQNDQTSWILTPDADTALTIWNILQNR